MKTSLLAPVLMLLALGAAGADGTQGAAADLGSDHFATGGDVNVAQPVDGDLIAAGGKVRVSAPVKGDGVVAGGHVDLDADLAQNLYAAGGEVRVNAAIARNARLAGGQVELGARGRVDGNVTAAGGDIAIRGAVKGYVQAAAGRVFIDAPVGGNVVVRSGHLTLGPNARIEGSLRYRGKDLVRDEGARITGGVTVTESAHRRAEAAATHGFAWGAWIWTAGLMVLAALVAGALPRVSQRFAPAVALRPALTILVGFLALVAFPAAAVVFIITIIGIPLGLLTLLAWLMLLLLGYVATAIVLGDSALRAWKSPAGRGSAARALAAIVAVLILALLTRIPFLGGFVAFATLVIGLGALMLSTRLVGSVEAAPATAP